MDDLTLSERLRQRGVSRRGFMKFCAATASMMALPPILIPKVAAALEQARRPSVIWLSFQECTGCTEAITRSSAPSLEELIFDSISLDYHHTAPALRQPLNCCTPDGVLRLLHSLLTGADPTSLRSEHPQVRAAVRTSRDRTGGVLTPRLCNSRGRRAFNP